MKILDDGAWADLLTPEHFLRMILEAVLASWRSLSVPHDTSEENPVTRQLYTALRRYSAQANLPFYVDSQWELVDDDGEVVGVPDIRFTPNVTRTGEHFFVVECKRLRYRYSDKCRSGNSEYIDGRGQGMTAFVDQRYPTPQGHGGMIGYILCDCEDPIGKIRRAIGKMRDRLGLEGAEVLRSSSLGITGVLETAHSVASDKTIVLHHVFLDAKECVGKC